jgi:hypothetical protein
MANDDFPQWKQAVAEGSFDALATLWNRLSMGRRMDMLVEGYWAEKRAAQSNPLVRAGRKFYSQNDEDGITLEIMRRIGLGSGVFVEFGAGDGLENNSLILLMHGWRGVWIGNEDLRINLPASNARLKYSKGWVSTANCVQLIAAGIDGLGVKQYDLLSIDLDGNDLHIAEAVMKSGAKPAVIVVEYNAKFPPPVRWSIEYNADHNWVGDDYQGASLQSFADLFGASGYRLVACNLTGTNAFFVSREYDAAFRDVPDDINALFIPADYNWFIAAGHAPSPKTIERFL